LELPPILLPVAQELRIPAIKNNTIILTLRFFIEKIKINLKTLNVKKPAKVVLVEKKINNRRSLA
jgi:hypothetical protein